MVTEFQDGAIIGLILGIGIGSIMAMVIISSTSYDIPIEEKYEEYKQTEQDCKIKEYYYMDNHRELCDKIGVTP